VGQHVIDKDSDAAELGFGHSPPRPWARLRRLLGSERRDIVGVCIFAFAVAVLSLATPIAVESLVNTVSFGVLMWPVIMLAIVLLACLGLAGAIRAAQVYVIECLQRRLFVRVVADYARRLPQLRIESFDHRYGPELANRFFDVVNVQKSLATLLLDGVAIIVSALVGMIVLAFYHPFLLGFDIALLILIAFLLFVLGWGGVRTSLHESHAKYDIAAWLEELIRELRAFKFSGGSRLALDKADHLASEFVAARKSHFRVVWRQTVFAIAIQVVASTVLLGLGGYLVIERQLTLGQLVASELIVAYVVASVAKLGKYADTFYDLMAGAEKLGLLTDLPLERDNGDPMPVGAKPLALRVRGLVRDGREAEDWSLESGERVALVGPPGSGKTTFVELLCGLRDPERGVVEVEGVDLRGLTLASFREQVALVGCGEVFAGTVIENVRMGRSEVPIEDVWTALELVGLRNAIHSLPRGLNTPLTATGSPLSTSQAVRLTLARALALKPRLMILDGVLDAIDATESPDLIPKLFDRAAPWSLLVVTDNPDIQARCDRRIVLAAAV